MILLMILVARRSTSLLGALTETMYDLARGNTEVSVPAMDRQDEIGSMLGSGS